MTCTQPIVLLFPSWLNRRVLDGGAEIVVEKRADGQKRFFLHLLDEVERKDEMRKGDPSLTRIHGQIIEELRWARTTLWGDARLQRYLYSCDWMTWPSLSELRCMVNLVRSAKETDDVPDYAGANNLKDALEIIEQETMYSGLHALREETLAGPLTVFGNSRKGVSVTNDTLHVLLDAGDQQCIGSSVWVVDLCTSSLLAQEAARLPLTRSVQEQCVQLAQPLLAAADLSGDDFWGAVQEAHRHSVECRALGFFFGIPECLQQFGMAPAHLAGVMHEAAERGRRVRLRVGVYLTLIQRTEVYIVMRASSKNPSADDELVIRTSFERVTSESYETCEAAGRIIRLDEGETLDDAVRLRFLSPIGAAHSVAETVSLAPSTQLTRVITPHNPFAIIHGPRVNGTFPENLDVRAALSELLLLRENADYVATSHVSERKTSVKIVAPSAVSTLTGEQLRSNFDEALFKTLSQEPLTKKTLSAHVNFAPFRDLANFDAIMKDSLKRNAECRGRKYYLKT